MLRDSLYLYAMLLFSFTALQAVEKCPEHQHISITQHHSTQTSTFPNYEEALAFYALIEDDNEDLEQITAKHFSICNQDENNPKAVKTSLHL